MTLLGDETVETTGFTVHLTNFSGPFDLLLQLIGKHKLDITEVALSRVTDEFIAHLRHAQGRNPDQDWSVRRSGRHPRISPLGKLDREQSRMHLSNNRILGKVLKYCRKSVIANPTAN